MTREQSITSRDYSRVTLAFFIEKNPMPIDALGVAAACSERSNGALWLTGNLYLSELLLILVDVFLQGAQQTLGMFGSHDDTAANLGLLHARQMACEVEDEIGV